MISLFIVFVASVFVSLVVTVYLYRLITKAVATKHDELVEGFNEQEETLAVLIGRFNELQRQHAKALSILMMLKKSMMTSLMRDSEMFDSMLDDFDDLVEGAKDEPEEEEDDRGESSEIPGDDSGTV